jgi:CheY-like chemotaxis protein
MSGEGAIVFIVDDDRSIREALDSLVRSVGFGVQTFASAQGFLASKRPDVPSCLVLDVHLPGLSDLDLQQELAKQTKWVIGGAKGAAARLGLKRTTLPSKIGAAGQFAALGIGMVQDVQVVQVVPAPSSFLPPSRGRMKKGD